MSDDASCEQALVVDNTGNIAFAGSYEGTIDFDPSAAVNTFTSNSGSSDAFICKLNSMGNLLWIKSIGGIQNDEAMTLGIDGSKNLIAGGRFRSQVDFDPNAGVTTYTAQGIEDSFVLKLDSLGNFVWANPYGSTNISANDRAGNLVVKSNGDVYVSDVFNFVVDFDPSPATATLSPIGIADAYVLKFNANGSFSWVKQVTGSGYMEPKALDIDFLGNVYFTGYYNGLNDCDPGVGTYTINSSTNAYFIIKLDPNGVYSWARSINAPGGDVLGVSVKIDPNGNIYSTGNFDSNGLDFDPDAGVTQLNLIGGGYDVFIHKFNQCLAPLVPTNATFSSLQSICSSANTTTLSATSSGTLTWFNVPNGGSSLGQGASFVTPTLSVGTHTFYSEANTCTISLSRTPITITVNPSPTITTLSSNTTICAGESATITASGASASSYSWSTNTLSQSIVISPTITTTYTVQGSLLACTSNATVTQVVDACSGLMEKNSYLNTTKIFPNPAKDFTVIESEVAPLKIKIINALGREVKRIESFRQEDSRINLAELTPGIYFLEVYSSSSYKTIKLIKE